MSDWPFMIAVLNANRLYVLNWKTVLPQDAIEALEQPATRWVYNRPIRHAVIAVYEHIFGCVSWIKDNGLDYQNKCPDQWEKCLAFIDQPNVDQFLQDYAILHVAYPCDPSQSPMKIWENADGFIASNARADLSIQHQHYILSQAIAAEMPQDKPDCKRKM